MGIPVKMSLFFPPGHEESYLSVISSSSSIDSDLSPKFVVRFFVAEFSFTFEHYLDLKNIRTPSSANFKCQPLSFTFFRISFNIGWKNHGMTMPISIFEGAGLRTILEVLLSSLSL